MAQPSKEPCKKEACDIQACLVKNNFLPHKTGNQPFKIKLLWEAPSILKRVAFRWLPILVFNISKVVGDMPGQPPQGVPP